MQCQKTKARAARAAKSWAEKLCLVNKGEWLFCHLLIVLVYLEKQPTSSRFTGPQPCFACTSTPVPRPIYCDPAIVALQLLLKVKCRSHTRLLLVLVKHGKHVQFKSNDNTNHITSYKAFTACCSSCALR